MHTQVRAPTAPLCAEHYDGWRHSLYIEPLERKKLLSVYMFTHALGALLGQWKKHKWAHDIEWFRLTWEVIVTVVKVTESTCLLLVEIYCDLNYIMIFIVYFFQCVREVYSQNNFTRSLSLCVSFRDCVDTWAGRAWFSVRSHTVLLRGHHPRDITWWVAIATEEWARPEGGSVCSAAHVSLICRASGLPSPRWHAVVKCTYHSHNVDQALSAVWPLPFHLQALTPNARMKRMMALWGWPSKLTKVGTPTHTQK